MILEGIVTTINEDGSTNISPMGPDVGDPITNFQLMPFQTSTTYRNLKRFGEGVLHITDDVLLLAQAAVGGIDPMPDLLDTQAQRGRILADCCRWYVFNVDRVEDMEPRSVLHCRVIEDGRVRDFFGFNRAKHAVVEAAILATRIHFLPSAEVLREFDRLAVLVRKTGGGREHDAFEFLHRYVVEATGTDHGS